jgi:myo-inositol-1(or 4)-monophosphatase
MGFCFSWLLRANFSRSVLPAKRWTPSDEFPQGGSTTMTPNDLPRALKIAVTAAREAGALMRRNLHATKVVNAHTRHDLKLELDVRCQRRIQRTLTRAFPELPILGEEESAAGANSDWRWVVDPIDGTVNYAHGIPHACVSIALQRATKARSAKRREPYESVVGVVYDPFCDELWTARRGQRARLNGRPIRVSDRPLSRAVVSLGFGKSAITLAYLLPATEALTHRVRKIRIMGAAALALCYVASGRFDAFAEPGLRLWDIAAGGLILECAGGVFWRRALPGEHRYLVNGHNGRLARPLNRLVAAAAEAAAD